MYKKKNKMYTLTINYRNTTRSETYTNKRNALSDAKSIVKGCLKIGEQFHINITGEDNKVFVNVFGQISPNYNIIYMKK